MSSHGVTYCLVVPTIGRESLSVFVAALAAGHGPEPDEIVIVDDRPDPTPPLAVGRGRARFVGSGGRGPAAARNAGWRTATTDWVVFLDDDVVPSPGWRAQVVADLADLPGEVGGSQGIVSVPLPADRRPTDWERGTAGLSGADWITADMAYRRTVLAETGGFDERFRRAYREDADLALRVIDAGHRLSRGTRRVEHPVCPAGFWASVRAQAGNADDVLMRRIHGRGWRKRSGAGRGRFRRHAVIVVSGLVALAGSRTALALWAALTAEFAVARILTGPRTPEEVARMVVTSIVIPPAAVAHRLRGLVRHLRVTPRRVPKVVLFDRDDTLVRDVPNNGDPDRVEPLPGAREALDRLRRQGIRVGVVSNQAGVARGHVSLEDVNRVNARVDELLGPFDVWEVCPHDHADGCGCRKPRPGLIERAAQRLDADTADCVVIGDNGTDVEAATAAGARPILVPTIHTRSDEVRRAPVVAADLAGAVGLALGARSAGRAR